MNQLKKRTTVFLQSPSVYSISSCSCGNDETQWSEYEKHLWCDKCKKDFIPKHNGIFDGPIPIKTAQILGCSFNRFNLETEKVECLDDDNQYVVCEKIETFFNNKKMNIILKVFNEISEIKLVPAILSFMDYDLLVELDSNISLLNDKDNLFSLTIKFEYPNTQTFNLNLILNQDFKTFNVGKGKDYIVFNQFFMTNKLNSELKINQTNIKVNKI